MARKFMLRLADNIAVIAENENEFQKMLRCMEKTLLNELNMKINTKRPKFLYVAGTIILGKEYICKTT